MNTLISAGGSGHRPAPTGHASRFVDAAHHRPPANEAKWSGRRDSNPRHSAWETRCVVMVLLSRPARVSDVGYPHAEGAQMTAHVPAEESVPPGSQRPWGDEPRRGARAHHHHRRMAARHVDGTDLTSVADVRHGWTPMTRLPQGVRVLRRLRPQSDSADRRAARARRIANPFRTASHEPHRRCRRLRRAHVRRTPLP